MSSPEIADIFRWNLDKLLNYSKQQWKAVNAIISCRTNRLGGHILKCPECAHIKYLYHSCRNRHCPKCGSLAKARWLENRMNEILPVEYYHVVFTLPSQLNLIVRYNERLLYNLLFQTVKETLLEAGKNPDNLGAEIGFLAVLHTWGQNLLDHPHIHCVVPGGGLSKDRSRWINCKKGFFISVKKLSRLFRGKFLYYLKRNYKNNRLKLAGKIEYLKNRLLFQSLINDLYCQEWVVYSKKPFSNPKKVFDYIGRYTHRIAITNNRLVSLKNNKVGFRWKDYKDGNKIKIMNLTVNEFMRRFLLHVLPDRFVRIRSYGILSNRSSEKLKSCKKYLKVKEKERKKPEPWYELFLKLTGVDIRLCESCHIGRYIMIDSITNTQLEYDIFKLDSS
jgi:hypothetical protein